MVRLKFKHIWEQHYTDFFVFSFFFSAAFFVKYQHHPAFKSKIDHKWTSWLSVRPHKTHRNPVIYTTTTEAKDQILIIEEIEPTHIHCHKSSFISHMLCATWNKHLLHLPCVTPLQQCTTSTHALSRSAENLILFSFQICDVQKHIFKIN